MCVGDSEGEIEEIKARRGRTASGIVTDNAEIRLRGSKCIILLALGNDK